MPDPIAPKGLTVRRRSGTRLAKQSHVQGKAIREGLELDISTSRRAVAPPTSVIEMTSGSSQKSSKSRLLLDSDVMLFFESEIKPQLHREQHAHGAHVFGDRPHSERSAALAHEEVLAVWNAEGMVAIREVVRRNLVRSLQAAVEAFQRNVIRDPIELRLEQIEQQFSALRSEFSRIAKSDPSQRASATLEHLKPHLETIRDACAQAFECVEVALSVQPSDNSDHPVTVTLDLSAGDPETIANSRAGGARRRFYESLLTQIPGEVFDAVEFDFKFPNE